MPLFDDLGNRKYKYKILTEIIHKDKELRDFLDDQGDIGWEAVHLEMEKDTDLEGKPCRWYRIVFKTRVA